jgi:two-component system, cell cycle response regulator
VSPPTTPTSGELVPLADRLRHLQALRLVFVAMFALAAWSAGDARLAAPALLAGGTAAYLGLASLLHLAARRATSAVGAALMLDGVALAAGAYLTGGDGSPVRLLVLLHLVAVALLASYRTALKVAVWHSLLVLVVFYARDGGVLEAQAAAGPGTPMQRLVGFIAVVWLVTITTSTASAMNERELRRRRYDLEALTTLARRLDEAEGAQAAAEVLVDAAVDVLDAPRALLLAAPDGGVLLPLGFHGDVLARALPAADSPDVAAAMASGATRLVSAPDSALAERLPGARRLVVVPLQPAGRPVGVLVVEHAGRAPRIERRVVSALEQSADHAALALRGAWLLEEVHHLAATDALTQIPNRGTFTRRLDEELARAARNGTSLGLVLLDVDHFKKLNDVHGHQVGDEVLKGVARVLSEHCREYDVPARYGGEEFVVVLPETDAELALRIATRLRLALEAADLGPPVTASFGVAAYPADGTTADQLVRAADDALYASKRAGRNRVTLARVAAAPQPQG